MEALIIKLPFRLPVDIPVEIEILIIQFMTGFRASQKSVMWCVN